MSKNSRDRGTEVSRLSESNPKACKKLILDSLWTNGGNAWRTATALGVSRPFFHAILTKLGISDLPTKVREQFQKR